MMIRRISLLRVFAYGPALNVTLILSVFVVDNTVQQILDDWMLWLSEYTIFMFFGPQNTKIILKFIG